MAGDGILYNDPGRTKYHGGKMTSYVFLACLIASSGGLIFGYDIGISGGVTSMDSFLKEFFPTLYHKAGHNSNKATNQYCKFNNELLTLFTSSFYLAAFFASFLASTSTRSFGRRLSMFFGGAVFLTGAILNGAAENVAMLIIGRLLLGVGVGFTNQSVPLYLSEMAPSSMRGMLNNIFPLMINIGILFANFVNYLSVDVEGGWGWRISLGSAAIPALIITVGSIFLPETPNSLIEQGEPESAHEMLKKIRGIDDVLDEYDELVAASEESRKVEHPWMNILKRKNRPQLVMSILIPFFQQLTGISIIMFYAPVLFKTIGLESDASLYSAVVTGGVTVLSTFLTIVAIDKVGRRFLFLEGGVQMFICQIVIGVLIGNKFGLTGKGSISKGYAEVILAFICVYVAAFAWSWGPLGLLVPSEIFPLQIRSAGQSINVSVNMLFTFIIAEVFLNMLCHMKYFLFFFFAGWVLVMTLFILIFLPETKSVPLEEMALVWGRHRFWGRFISDQDIPQGIQIVARRRQTSI